MACRSSVQNQTFDWLPWTLELAENSMAYRFSAASVEEVPSAPPSSGRAPRLDPWPSEGILGLPRQVLASLNSLGLLPEDFPGMAEGGAGALEFGVKFTRGVSVASLGVGAPAGHKAALDEDPLLEAEPQGILRAR